MMEAAETGKGDDLAELGRLFGTVLRRVRLQGEVHSVPVVPSAKLAKQALGVPLVEHDTVVKPLAAKGANHPLCKRIHPRGSYGGADLADAEEGGSSLRPGFGRLRPDAGQIAGHRALADEVAEFEELAVDPGRTPGLVLL